MPSIRVGSLRLTIYPNDHAPPHVHVIAPDWQLRIVFEGPVLEVQAGRPAGRDLRAALRAVNDHRVELELIWNKIHGHEDDQANES